MIDDESCNWALRDSLAGETQSQSRSSSTLDGTQRDFTSVLSCCVVARLNAINGTLINQSGIFLTCSVMCSSAVMTLIRMCCQTQRLSASAAVISTIGWCTRYASPRASPSKNNCCSVLPPTLLEQCFHSTKISVISFDS